MKPLTTDTIAAIATAPGEGGVAIVRLSGPEAESILLQVFRPVGRNALPLTSHLLTYGHAVSGAESIDECMAVLMRAPRSYTREDVAEIHLHGGAYLSQRVLALCLDRGARLAEPGEFTRRAFLNGRIDLSQAEAVMSLIAARGEQSRRAAMRQLQGGASAFIREAADELYALQAGVAACIDYPEEIGEDEAAADLVPRAIRLADSLDAACDERAGRILQSGLQVALCGQPNVGKSSLLNALLGEERAIVTPIPGTTRDMVTGDVTLGGSVIHLTDTAGLHHTDDPVEQIGVARARQAIMAADLVLAVLDASHPLTDDDRELLSSLQGQPCAVILGKSDLPAVLTPADVQPLLPEAPILTLSANNPATLAPLKVFLADQAAVSDRLALTQPRHMEAARRASSHLRQAAATARSLTVDMASLDLQAAQLALAEITGDEVEERLLDRVFGMFCVGK
ncbi:MAG: tRNA uridine-5-carboxymethylaminomethyl(34) synthesis GTPase MnmE [Clostridia bacterium]|nr:tRNA uridine-5-carboxymethylaminomethyl(34) synthesis GTPase MnmE [Clostridia bacterium]